MWLRAEIDGASLTFHASPDGKAWTQIGGVFDASKLSDDYGSGLRFTGTLVGICAQDINNHRTTADFDYFTLG